MHVCMCVSFDHIEYRSMFGCRIRIETESVELVCLCTCTVNIQIYFICMHSHSMVYCRRNTLTLGACMRRACREHTDTIHTSTSNSRLFFFFKEKNLVTGALSRYLIRPICLYISLSSAVDR